MKRILIGVAMLATSTAALAQGSHPVRGYTRADGTYVAPHMQTNPNSTRLDNWSTQGNVNPYTGQTGTVDPYAPRATTPSTTSPNPYPYNNPYRRR